MALATAAALLLADSSALAQPRGAVDVDAEIRQGLALREQGRDADALAVFERAYARAPSPRALAQIGLAEQALGRFDVAATHVAAALDAARDPWIAQHRAALEDALAYARQQLGAGGATTRGDAVPAAAPVPTASPPPHESEPRDLPAPRPAHADDSVVRTLGWVAAGGALAALGVGVVGHVLREIHYQRWNSDGCVSAQQTRMELCPGELAAGDTAQGVMIGGYVAAGALAVTSLVLLLSHPAPAAPAARARAFACGGGPGALGVACAGVF